MFPEESCHRLHSLSKNLRNLLTSASSIIGHLGAMIEEFGPQESKASDQS